MRNKPEAVPGRIARLNTAMMLCWLAALIV